MSIDECCQVAMDCISKLVRGRSSPPPLPPKPSAPSPDLRYPPQVPYYHEGRTNYQNQMRVIPQHFAPHRDEFYQSATVENFLDNLQIVPLVLFEEYNPPLPPLPTKPPMSPVLLNRPRRPSLPRICAADSIFTSLQSAEIEGSGMFKRRGSFQSVSF